MSRWFSNPFGRPVHVPTAAFSGQQKVLAKEKPKVFIRNTDNLREFLNADKKNSSIYRFNNRRFLANPNLVLNFFLYYCDKRSKEDKVRYKVDVKVIIEFIDFCHFNSMPADAQNTRIALGASLNDKYAYITLVDEDQNAVLSTGLKYEHPSFKTTAANMFRACSQKKERTIQTLNSDALKTAQREMKRIMEPYIGSGKPIEELEESASDVTYTESYDSSDVTPGDTSIAAPLSIRKEIEKREEKESALAMPLSERKKILEPVTIITPVIANNDNAVNASDVVNIDQTLMDDELIEQLNNNETITSLLEPEPGQSNIEILHPVVLLEAEKEVLKDAVKEVVEKHHKRSRDESDFSEEDILNMSTQRKLLREERRYDSRMRTGRLHTGPNTIANTRLMFDYRFETRDAAGREINPNRSYRNQDDDYLDYAFYGFIREYGTLVSDIMKLPMGYDFNSLRRGSNVVIKALHFRNTFTHVTGTKASGRMILFYSERDFTKTEPIIGRTWLTIEPEDILQKSVTMYAGDLEELEAADVFYNPTIMSQYDFKNVILGRKFQILYDYYVDLNTQAVKGVVGEDIESVDSIKTKWVKIDDLELPFFYDGEDKLPTRGVLGVLFMGDYFGGEIETNMTLRVFYNSH